MAIFVAYFSQMGRNGCGEDPTLLLQSLQEHISSWGLGFSSVETKCYQAPGRWASYLTESDDESKIGDNVYETLGGTAWNAWHELQEKYDSGECLFLFIGASNGCIPASFFAHQFSDKTLSLTLLSCVPGREQWGDIARLRCPVTVTCGNRESFFGKSAGIYSFAQTVHANVFSFWGTHLREGHDTLRRLAIFVSDASRPRLAKAGRHSKQRKSSPSPSPDRSRSKKSASTSPRRGNSHSEHT